MIFEPLRLKVVASWPGLGTGETVYKTEDGKTWKEYPDSMTATVPGTIAEYRNGYMEPK